MSCLRYRLISTPGVEACAHPQSSLVRNWLLAIGFRCESRGPPNHLHEVWQPDTVAARGSAERWVCPVRPSSTGRCRMCERGDEARRRLGGDRSRQPWAGRLSAADPSFLQLLQRVANSICQRGACRIVEAIRATLSDPRSPELPSVRCRWSLSSRSLRSS